VPCGMEDRRYGSKAASIRFRATSSAPPISVAMARRYSSSRGRSDSDARRILTVFISIFSQPGEPRTSAGVFARWSVCVVAHTLSGLGRLSNSCYELRRLGPKSPQDFYHQRCSDLEFALLDACSAKERPFQSDVRRQKPGRSRWIMKKRPASSGRDLLKRGRFS
jgi:hypothetical protein